MAREKAASAGTIERFPKSIEDFQKYPSQRFVKGFHGVRYQVRDVERSAAFYIERFGFELEHQSLPESATVSFQGVRVFLSGPGASGSFPMTDGRRQEPGGWNRVVLRVAELPKLIVTLQGTEVRFRTEMQVSRAGKQIQVEDPDGNPIELFEPAH